MINVIDRFTTANTSEVKMEKKIPKSIFRNNGEKINKLYHEREKLVEKQLIKYVKRKVGKIERNK